MEPKNYHKLEQCDNSLYLHMIMEKSKETRIYMLVQDLNIIFEKNQHIMVLINFMNKPYLQPEKPPYVRDAQFNNYRPFQTLIEMTNTSV